MANFAKEALENINYCGKEAQEIFVKDLYESNLRGYGINYMSGVKGKQKLMFSNASFAKLAIVFCIFLIYYFIT